MFRIAIAMTLHQQMAGSMQRGFRDVGKLHFALTDTTNNPNCVLTGGWSMWS